MLVLVFTSSHVDRQIVAILQEPIKQAFDVSDAQLGLLTGVMFAVLVQTAKHFRSRFTKVSLAFCKLQNFRFCIYSAQKWYFFVEMQLLIHIHIPEESANDAHIVSACCYMYKYVHPLPRNLDDVHNLDLYRAAQKAH